MEARNQADASLYQSEKQLTEMGDKLDGETKSKLETAIGRLKEAIKGSNVDEIKSATEQLNKEWNEAATKMYAKTGQQPGAEQAGPQQEQAAGAGQKKSDDGNGKSEVQDADFEVVDDEKKN